jgi:hypothetical protein
LLLAVCLLPVGVYGQTDPREEVVKQMRPASGIEAEPTNWWSSWPTWLMVAGVGLAAIALGALAALRLARDRRKTAAVTAHQAALQELRHLEALDLPVKGEVDRFHTELSAVMRRYLERRYRIAATQQTTQEFLETMRHSQRLQPNQQILLREFLEQCDLAKFAGLSPSPDQCRDMVESARRFVELTATG